MNIFLNPTAVSDKSKSHVNNTHSCIHINYNPTVNVLTNYLSIELSATLNVYCTLFYKIFFQYFMHRKFYKKDEVTETNHFTTQSHPD